MTTQFNYNEAFSRNIGLLSVDEQKLVKHFTIAIPGMGGVGGSHLISLIRQGFENFKIADLDAYELKNFNRQYGAKIATVGRQKAEVMREEALNINPHSKIELFPTGISVDNIDAFLDGVDLAVDSLDAFCVEERRLLINTALSKNIPVISAGPIGFGTAFLIFLPGGPNFDEYFDVTDNTPYDSKLVSFFVGLMPKLLQRSYMRGTNLDEKRGPSSIGAINLCSGVVAIYALKILLGKGKVKAVPYYHQFDIMKERYVCKKLWFGNKNPIQRLKIKIAKHLTTD